jgi:hypothetical protein
MALSLMLLGGRYHLYHVYCTIHFNCPCAYHGAYNYCFC